MLVACLFVCLLVSLFVCLFVCLFVNLDQLWVTRWVCASYLLFAVHYWLVICGHIVNMRWSCVGYVSDMRGVC